MGYSAENGLSCLTDQLLNLFTTVSVLASPGSFWACKKSVVTAAGCILVIRGYKQQQRLLACGVPLFASTVYPTNTPHLSNPVSFNCKSLSFLSLSLWFFFSFFFLLKIFFVLLTGIHIWCGLTVFQKVIRLWDCFLETFLCYRFKKRIIKKQLALIKMSMWNWCPDFFYLLIRIYSKNVPVIRQDYKKYYSHRIFESLRKSHSWIPHE